MTELTLPQKLAQQGAEIRAAVDGPKGYWGGSLLTAAEHETFRLRIASLFISRLMELRAPVNIINGFMGLGATCMRLYHRMPDGIIDHKTAWPQRSRYLDTQSLRILRNSSIASALFTAFGGAPTLDITAEGGGGDPMEVPPELADFGVDAKVIWRLVRPGQDGDVGPLHTDQWFWDANGRRIPPGMRAIKVWTLLEGEDHDCGLAVMPGSHRVRWPYNVEKRDGENKPSLTDADHNVFAPGVLMRPGQTVIFHHDLLHGGMLPIGDACRVSFEFTVLVPAS